MDSHLNCITSKAFKVLLLLHSSISAHHSPKSKPVLYLSLAQPQIAYCSHLWHPHTIRDMCFLERIQWKATKFILNDYSSDNRQRLVTLNLRPISLWLELKDILFIIACFKNPRDHFNIFKYIQFVTSSTRSFLVQTKVPYPFL